MRPRTLLPGALLLSLLLSGWSSVLVAAFCAHDAGRLAAMVEDHECCRVNLETEPEHCADAAPAPSSHEAMAMAEMEPAPSVAEPVEGNAVAFAETARTCWHCMKRGGLPPPLVFTRGPEPRKRVAAVTATSTPAPAVWPAASFAPRYTFKQGAPPGSAHRRHLLLNIFVI